jgi:hypothetical protein
MEAHLFKVNSDWRRILKKAWSSWFMWAAGILTALEICLPMLWDHGLLDLPPYVYPALMGALVAGALVARILMQREFEG